MKATELRIGNYLDFEGEPMQFEREDFNYEFNLSSQWQPIQLTEEWLIKFGFKKHNEMTWLDTEHTETQLPNLQLNNFKPDEEIGMFLDDKYGVIIKYVHQLQNLYFALTNKELKIKE